MVTANMHHRCTAAASWTHCALAKCNLKALPLCSMPVRSTPPSCRGLRMNLQHDKQPWRVASVLSPNLFPGGPQCKTTSVKLQQLFVASWRRDCNDQEASPRCPWLFGQSTVRADSAFLRLVAKPVFGPQDLGVSWPRLKVGIRMRVFLRAACGRESAQLKIA